MATNRALRAALLQKLSTNKQGLSRRVQRKLAQMPMSTEDATYLIAHESGIRVDKYLTPEQVDRVRNLHAAAAKASVASSPPSRKIAQDTVREIRFPGEVGLRIPLLSATKVNEAKDMARIFPLLYLIENSMRELIKRVMSSACGVDWWNTELTSGKLKNVHQTAEARMRDEHSWHQRRGSHPIDYVDFGDLESIILAKQDRFIPHIISDREWYIQFMKELKPSRNVVCHMNPLDAHNIADLKVRVTRWRKLLEAAEGKVPS